MRLFGLFFLICIFVALPFIVWGDWFDSFLEGEKAVEWLRSFGAMAWVVGVALLLLDIVLPIPATGVMAALGIIYGPVWGGIIGACGSILSGLVGYVLSRRFGLRAAEWVAGKEDIKKCEAFFAAKGGFAVMLSRWLPVMPEAVSCLAGLARMRFSVFLASLVFGTIPMAFVYAFLGYENSANPVYAIIFSILIPVVLWIPARIILRKNTEEADKR